DEDAGKWVELPSTVDTATHTITASVEHFTTFAIIGVVTPPPLPPAPAAFTSSALTISPTEVAIGESVTISVLVTNTGDLAGSYEVVLKIDGAPVVTKVVTLGAGESIKVTFSVIRDVAATYQVEIDGQRGQFTIVPPLVYPSPPLPFPWWWIVVGVVVIGLLVFFLVIPLTRRR
ncbi:unnamed protein product, partial [marine sediment metagenome]